MNAPPVKHSIEYLNWVLGEALEDICEAGAEVRELDGIDQKRCLHGLGRATADLWEIREHLFELKPVLETAAYREARENSRERYNKLVSLHSEADEAEQREDWVSAKRLYEQLRAVAQRRHRPNRRRLSREEGPRATTWDA